MSLNKTSGRFIGDFPRIKVDVLVENLDDIDKALIGYKTAKLNKAQNIVNKEQNNGKLCKMHSRII